VGLRMTAGERKSRARERRRLEASGTGKSRPEGRRDNGERNPCRTKPGPTLQRREKRRLPFTEALAGLRDASGTGEGRRTRVGAAPFGFAQDYRYNGRGELAGPTGVTLTHSGSSFTTCNRLREYVLGIRPTN
jgi:hypothetical protein